MPNGDTFSVPPIGEFVKRYLAASQISVDPFARDKRWATYTNDLNPATQAEYHEDATDFLLALSAVGVRADLGIFDPPYSPRQISELYKGIGKTCTMKDTQTGAMYKAARDALCPIIDRGGVVLSFGWSSVGMGKTRGWEIEEILLVCHGGAHNDTICIAERKL